MNFAGYQGNYGNLVVIDHGYGLETRYGHLQSFGVTKGGKVQRGDVIGRVGATGRATGSHLHYEVLANGTLLNPLRLLTTESPRSVAGASPARILAGCRPRWRTIGRYSLSVFACN